MREYKIICEMDPIINFDGKVSWNDVVFYYDQEKLIVETSVLETDLPEAQKVGMDKINNVCNALATRLNTNFDCELITIQETSGSVILNHSHNDIFASLVCRVPLVEEDFNKVQAIVDLSTENEKVRKVLRFVNDSSFATWVTLYKVFEIIDRDQLIIDEGWISKTKKENFKRTANHPASSGDTSRHGVPKSEKEHPPAKPMKLDDAEKLIRTLVEKWLDKLAG